MKDYVKTGNGVKSALKNYDTDDYATAGVIAVENLEKPKIIQAIADRIPDDLLQERHLELLNKREVVRDLEGNEVYDAGPDVPAVTKGLDMAYKLKGSYAPGKSTSLTVNLDARITDPDAEALRLEYEEKLKAKLLQ